MTESEFTRWMCDELRKCNCYVIAFVASAMQQPGIPDRYVCGKDLPGCWVEMKARNGSLSEDQKQVLRNFEERKVPYLVGRYLGWGLQWEDRLGNVLGRIELPLPKDRPAGVYIRESMVNALGRWSDAS